MNINTTLIPKSYISGNNSWDIIDRLTNAFPKWDSMFDLIASPTYSFSEAFGFTENPKIKNQFNLEIEIPRFRKENIKITTENNKLFINAEQDGLKFYHSINIPDHLDQESIEAELDHGVLTIKADKIQKFRSKKVNIK
jgi:HSP20 family molecular chaperone IbpA